MKTILSVAICVIALTGFASGQNKSVYTSTRSKCKVIKAISAEGGSYIGECRGSAATKSGLLEGDIRQTLTLSPPGKKKFELNFWGFYGGFSTVGEKVEWRTKGRRSCRSDRPL